MSQLPKKYSDFPGASSFFQTQSAPEAGSVFDQLGNNAPPSPRIADPNQVRGYLKQAGKFQGSFFVYKIRSCLKMILDPTLKSHRDDLSGKMTFYPRWPTSGLNWK